MFGRGNGNGGQEYINFYLMFSSTGGRRVKSRYYSERF